MEMFEGMVFGTFASPEQGQRPGGRIGLDYEADEVDQKREALDGHAGPQLWKWMEPAEMMHVAIVADASGPFLSGY